MISLNAQKIYTGRGLSRAVPAQSPGTFLVIYERKNESTNVEVEAGDEAAAVRAADRILISSGDSPARYKRPAWGRNRINTVRRIDVIYERRGEGVAA